MNDARPESDRGRTSTEHGCPPLAGTRICLVFEHSLSHYTRLLQEIAALSDAGADMRILTSLPESETTGVSLPTTHAPLPMYAVVRPPDIRQLQAASGLPPRILRALIQASARVLSSLVRPLAVLERRRALRSIAADTDVFWVIDFPSLAGVVRACRRSETKIVYETVDLVPEYLYRGDRYRRRQLRREAQLVGEVDGFITAADSYADYYVERYGHRGLARRPTVRDNMPAEIVSTFSPTHEPLELLFLGSLMFDRPIEELIHAMSLVKADVRLTFQGRNDLGNRPAELVAEYGLSHRVRVISPCPPDEIVVAASRYDVGIVALRGVDENERRASTSKLFTYLAAGLAVIASDLPGIARVVEPIGNGILVPSMEPDAWATAIDDMAAMGSTRINEMKSRSVEAAAQHSWEAQKAEFIAEFQRAIAGRSPSGHEQPQPDHS